MNNASQTVAEQIAEMASALQQQRTGHAPRAVTVVLSEDTLVVTLHDALSLAERSLARTLEGAAQVQEFHRQLFASCTDEMRAEIKRITGRDVREASAEVEPASGAVVHAFTSGAMVQVFLLRSGNRDHSGSSRASVERAEDDGLRVAEYVNHKGSTS